ncbi:hypothetical protein AAMO2058_000192800 [Amorphochlora amoebiformis]
MGLPDDSESRSKLYQEELMKLQTSEQKISSTAISLPEGSMFGRVTGRIATITGVDSQQVRIAGIVGGIAIGSAGGLIVFKFVRGLVSRIRTAKDVPIAALHSHESISGTIARVENENIFRLSHNPTISLGVTEAGDDETIRIRLAGIESLSKERTEAMLPSGQAVTVQLIGKSSMDDDVINGLVWRKYRPFSHSINLRLINDGYAKITKIDNRVMEAHFPHVLGQFRRYEYFAQIMRRGKWDEINKPGIVWGLIYGVRALVSFCRSLF